MNFVHTSILTRGSFCEKCFQLCRNTCTVYRRVRRSTNVEASHSKAPRIWPMLHVVWYAIIPSFPSVTLDRMIRPKGRLFSQSVDAVSSSLHLDRAAYSVVHSYSVLSVANAWPNDQNHGSRDGSWRLSQILCTWPLVSFTGLVLKRMEASRALDATCVGTLPPIVCSHWHSLPGRFASRRSRVDPVSFRILSRLRNDWARLVDLARKRSTT